MLTRHPAPTQPIALPGPTQPIALPGPTQPIARIQQSADLGAFISTASNR
jgi:hypothetical protein